MTIVVYSAQLNALAVIKDDPADSLRHLWEVSDETALSMHVSELFYEILGSSFVPWFSWDWIFLGEL